MRERRSDYVKAIAEVDVIAAAGRILDIFGNSTAWRDTVAQGDKASIMDSADWEQAMLYARAALHPAPSSEDRAKALHASPDFYGSLEDARAAVQAEDERAPSSEEGEKAVGDSVLAMLRQPTEEMLVAGLNELDPIGKLLNWNHMDCLHRDDLAKAFAAMVAPVLAALSQPEQQGGGAVAKALDQIEHAIRHEGQNERFRSGISIASIHASLAQARAALAPVSDPKDLEAELREARGGLRLAANRFARLSIEFPPHSHFRFEATDWAREAEAIIARLHKKGDEE